MGSDSMLLPRVRAYDFDRYLLHPPREPAYRRHRLHKNFVMCLDRAFPGLTPADLSAGVSLCLQSILEEKRG